MLNQHPLVTTKAAVKSLLKEYGLKLDDIFRVTTDNASAMKAAFRRPDSGNSWEVMVAASIPRLERFELQGHLVDAEEASTEKASTEEDSTEEDSTEEADTAQQDSLLEYDDDVADEEDVDYSTLPDLQMLDTINLDM